MTLFALATEAAAIAQTTQHLVNEVNQFFSRGAVVHIENRTSVPLELVKAEHDSGGFNDPPDGVIPANHASLFGSKGSLSLGPTAVGHVQYSAGGVDLAYYIGWEVPLVGDNTGSSRCDGGARQYFQTNSSVGAFASSIAKHDLSFKPMEDQWRRCSRCATMNRQRGGLDSACVSGTTHDNMVSKNYFLISGAIFGVDPFAAQHCTKCDCLILVPVVPSICAAGGIHESLELDSYVMVDARNAPGDTGWQACLRCWCLVIDRNGPCPSGGTHETSPAPVFTFWGN